MSTHLEAAKAEARLRSVGWDGANKPIIELRADCGCKWTQDGQYLLGTCVAALREAV